MSFPQTLTSGSESGKSSSILIELSDPQVHGVGNKRYVDYLVTTKTTLSMFDAKEFSVRRRFSDFEYLKTKLEQTLKVCITRSSLESI